MSQTSAWVGDHLKHPGTGGCDLDGKPARGRAGPDPSAGEADEASSCGHLFAPPESADGPEGLVQPGDPLPRRRQREAEAPICRLSADRDQEAQPAGGDALQGGGGLGETRRVPVVDQADRADLDPFGAGQQRRGDGPAVEHIGFPAARNLRDIAIHEGRLESRRLGTTHQIEQLLEAQ